MPSKTKQKLQQIKDADSANFSSVNEPREGVKCGRVEKNTPPTAVQKVRDGRSGTGRKKQVNLDSSSQSTLLSRESPEDVNTPSTSREHGKAAAGRELREEEKGSEVNKELRKVNPKATRAIPKETNTSRNGQGKTSSPVPRKEVGIQESSQEHRKEPDLAVPGREFREKENSSKVNKESQKELHNTRSIRKPLKQKSLPQRSIVSPVLKNLKENTGKSRPNANRSNQRNLPKNVLGELDDESETSRKSFENDSFDDSFEDLELENSSATSQRALNDAIDSSDHEMTSADEEETPSEVTPSDDEVAQSEDEMVQPDGAIGIVDNNPGSEHVPPENSNSAAVSETETLINKLIYCK